MKKTVFLIFLTFIIIFSCYSQNGVIREITGDVTIKTSGAASFAAARAGTAVAQDAIISTGFKSTAIIEIGSSLITVRPLTRLSLAEIRSSSGAENLNINLEAGRIKVDVKPPAGTRANITVQSPSSSASVRGTSFEMGSMNIEVFEGRIGWKGSSGVPVMVSGGGVNYINQDGYPLNPIKVIQSGYLRGPAGYGYAGESYASFPVVSNNDVNLSFILIESNK